MKIEIPDPKFKFGQTVFFVKEAETEHGDQHKCTGCGQLHYAGRYVPIVTEVVVAGCMNWNVSTGGGRFEVRGPFYQVDDTRRGMSRYGANEEDLFATLEEAMGQQLARVKARTP